PKAKAGADGPFKEFKIVTLYDDAAEHRLVSVTGGDCAQAGRRMRRAAGRGGLDRAGDKVGVVDGSVGSEEGGARQGLAAADPGRQTGSGPTESMCKATTQRIKGRGMRGDGDNADSIMALEALEQSGGWQAYWDLQLAMAACLPKNLPHPGNPFARKVAALRTALINFVTVDDMKHVAFILKEKAMGGDLVAAKLLLQYILG